MSASDDLDTERFYAFERAARAQFEPEMPQDLPREQLAATIMAAFDRFGYPSGNVHLICGETIVAGVAFTTGKTIFAHPNYLIILPPTRQRVWCALHEAAHVLHPGINHGPAFATTCIRLWVELGGWPSDVLWRLGEEHDVRQLYETEH